MLLSVCIPTYNRAQYLAKTLQSIVEQDGFGDKVEIVISDNCSTDSTGELCRGFAEKYRNIRYHRNGENVRDENLVMVLERASGEYLKLVNDTAIFLPGALHELILLVERYHSAKPVLFFLNRNVSKNEICEFCSLDSFVRRTSFFVTWVLGFGIWRDHFQRIETKTEGVELNLVQTVLLFKNVAQVSRAIVFTKELFSVQDVKDKGGYNLMDVFVGNYVGKVLLQYYRRHKVSIRTYALEKTKLLIRFLVPWFITLNRPESRYRISTKGSYKVLLKYYWSNPFLYAGMIYAGVRLATAHFKRMLKRALNALKIA